MPQDYRAGRPPQRPMADPYPDTPRERQRTAMIRTVAVAVAVTAVAVTVGVVWLANSGGKPGQAAAGASAPASQSYDQSTLLACREAHAAAHGDGTNVSRHASSARSFAALSDVPALRDVSAQNTRVDESGQPIDDVRALTAAYSVDTWCLTHKIPGS